MTTDVTVPGAAATATIVGEGAAIFTANERVFLNDTFEKTGLRTALSDSDLPVLLKSGTIDDSDGGTTYDFDLFIDFSNDFPLSFSTASDDLDNPTYLFGEFGTTASSTSNVYRSRIVFNDEVNATTVIGEEMEIFGSTFTFLSGTSGSGSGKVELSGGADKRILEEGETVSATVDGAPIDVKLLVVSDADTIGIQVGGDSKSIDKGVTATVGGIEVFVDDVFFTSKEGTVSSASLLIGAKKLILTDGTNAKVKVGGSQEKTVDGTFVDILLSSGKITGIDVFVSGVESDLDFLALGGEYDDPAWGTFKLVFPSLTSDVKDASRDEISVLPAGTRNIELSMTTDRGDKGTVKFAHINTTTQVIPDLSDDGGDSVIVVENQGIQLNDYFLVDSGDFSRMFELTSVSSLGTSDAELTIRDVFSSNSIDVDLGSDNHTQKIIDGQTYFFNASTAVSSDLPNLRVTWGDTSAVNSVGDFVTVYPTLESWRGARVALMGQVNVSDIADAGNLQLPTGALDLDWDGLAAGASSNLTLTAITTEKNDASVITNASSAGSTIASLALTEGSSAIFRLGKTATGGALYRITNNGGGANSLGRITVEAGKSATTFSNNTAALNIEEEDDSSNIHSILVDATTRSDGSNRETEPVIAIGQFSDARVLTDSPSTNSDLEQYVDFWGTYAEQNTDDQNTVRLWYPDNQVSANVFLLDNDASVSVGTVSAGQTVKSAVPIKTPLGRLDTEITSADKANKNLILVGGPAVNSLVLELANAGKTWDRDGYVAEGVGTTLIDYVEDAFATGNVALIVAGHSAPDTREGAKVLQDFDAFSQLTGERVVLKNGVFTQATA